MSALSTAPAGPSVDDPGPGSDRYVHRVVVVDDHELLRAGTRRILDDATGFTVVGEAADGPDALRVIDEVRPDVVLMDIRLPTINGIDLARQIVEERPATTVLILSAYDDEHYIRAALSAGVAGYLLKTAPSDELIRSIRDACDGLTPPDPFPSGRGEKAPSGDGGPAPARLTAREQEVVRQVARGRSNKAIAHQLGISPRTVEGHLNHVFEKVGSRSRTELVHYALASGLFVRDADERGTTTVSRPTTPEAEVSPGLPTVPAELLPSAGPGRPASAGPSDAASDLVADPASEIQPPTTAADLADDRPWANSGFWILQLVVLALSLTRLAATVAFHLDSQSLALEISTLALFLIPVVFAALNYGLAGALFTSGWITLLAVPRFSAAVAAHEYIAASAELIQIVLLDVLAILIGQRVTSERAARRLAETSREAHLQAEAMYRDLFDCNQAPILIVDADGFVVETNTAAQKAFGREAAAPAGRSVRLVDMVGPEAAGRVLTRLVSRRSPVGGPDGDVAADPEPIEPLRFDIGDDQVLFRPTVTMLGASSGSRRLQVIFEDVTAETRRHDRMEAYAEQVVHGQEEERRHIAQELHDGPLQTLIHLCRQIDEIDANLPSGDGSTGTSPLSGLRSIVERTVSELRSIAKGLRPSILDDLGLVASINQMLADAGDRNRFETSFGVTGSERRLPTAVELAAFRIAQEALSNIERHAAARKVAVGMDFDARGLRLLVKDDGMGFDPPSRRDGRSSSLGLPGMIERAHLIGARLVIHSEPGGGTTVDVWIPTTESGEVRPIAHGFRARMSRIQTT